MIDICLKILRARLNGIVGRPMPLKVSIPITFACNLKCKTCNLWSEFVRNPDAKARELDAQSWFKVFDEIGDSVIWLDIGGGEFSMRPDIEQIVLYALNKTEIQLVGLISNGVLFERILDIVGRVMDGNSRRKSVRLSLSLDGLQQIHDRIRGQDGVFDSVVRLFNELKKIQQKNPYFRVNLVYTISEYNLGELSNFWKNIQRFILLSPQDLTFNFQHYTHGFRVSRNELYGNNFPYEKLDRDISCALQIVRKRGKDILQDFIQSKMRSFYLKKITTYIARPERMVIPCISAGNYSAYIDPDGTMYPCGHWNYSLGNVKEGFFKIWNSAKADAARKAIKRGNCSNCWGTCEYPQNWILGGGYL